MMFADAADHRRCRDMIRTGSRTFYAASLLLPSAMRTPAYALYAFCRLSDDAVDVGDGRRGAVERLQARLDAIYAGRPEEDPVDRSFADTVLGRRLPKALPEALLEGMAWDVEGRRYQTLDDLYDYCARVAGSVGAMMAALMGARDANVLARACDLGAAMQLTNIARDVGEDARAGRIYLPLAWLEDAGVDAAALIREPRFSPALGGVVRRLLEAADQLYVRAETGIAALPMNVRPAMFAARRIYAAIGTEVARNGYDSVNARAFTTTSRKLSLLARSCADSIFGPSLDGAPPLAANRFLVAAAAQPVQRPPIPWWDIDGRVGGVMELFLELERRKRGQLDRAPYLAD